MAFDFLFDDSGNLFDWAGEGLFGLIGGAAQGAGAYYAAKEQREAAEDLYERRMQDKDSRYRASTVGKDEYGKAYKTLTGGMLTNSGLLAPKPQ